MHLTPEVAEQIGIHRLTYGLLESDKRKEQVKPVTYTKICNWLAKDY